MSIAPLSPETVALTVHHHPRHVAGTTRPPAVAAAAAAAVRGEEEPRGPIKITKKTSRWLSGEFANLRLGVAAISRGVRRDEPKKYIYTRAHARTDMLTRKYI